MTEFDIDITNIPTPCYLVDERLLQKNMEVLKSVSDKTGCRILLAQKAFSMFSVYPLIGEYLSGATASGLYEAKLAHEYMKGENHIFSPAYKENEIDEIASICGHVVFNSFSQLKRFGERVRKQGASVGLRINPEHSTQQGHEIYDPCAKGSRLGIPLSSFKPELLEGVEGLHFHTLCEQNTDALSETLKVVEEKFGPYMKQMKWINFGGGHHITRSDYDIAILTLNGERVDASEYEYLIYKGKKYPSWKQRGLVCFADDIESCEYAKEMMLKKYISHSMKNIKKQLMISLLN